MAYRGRGGHPIYVGCLFTFWAAQHQVCALAKSTYIPIAIQLEERDWSRRVQSIEDYRRRAPMLLQFMKRRQQVVKCVAVGG